MEQKSALLVMGSGGRWRERLPCAVLFGILAATVWILRAQGRRWWCACGSLVPWSGDVRSTHTSQHLVDAYSVTHVLHGVVFCGVVRWLFPRLSRGWTLTIVVAVEALWELFENSQFVIERFRAATLAPGHNGDTIANSVVDIVACGVGVLLARRIGLRRSIVLFVIAELVLLFWIRDGLTLILLMSIHHFDGIAAWQRGG